MAGGPVRVERWRVTIVGLGLIGASAGMRLRAEGHWVGGMDRDPRHLDRALSLGAVDAEVAGRPGEADVVLLAAPPRANIEWVRHPWQAPLVIDTSSVKEPVVQAAREAGVPFVGGHPLAGRAEGGPDAARPDLFQGRTFLLTAAGGPMEQARAVAQALGALPVEIGAAEHDRAVARTSHLVYLMSCALAEVLRDSPAQLLGPAAHEMLRVATSPTGLWEEILSLNAAAVGEAATALAEEIRRLSSADGEDLARARRAAEQLRRRWSDAG